MKRSIGVRRIEVKGMKFRAIHNDCIEELATMPDNSVDEIITSIPLEIIMNIANVITI